MRACQLDPRRADPQDSGKLAVTMALLQAWSGRGSLSPGSPPPAVDSGPAAGPAPPRTLHRALVFAQTRQMLDIIEAAVALGGQPLSADEVAAGGLRPDTPRRGFRYIRMDGTTPVAQRDALVTAFNNETLLARSVSNSGVNPFAESVLARAEQAPEAAGPGADMIGPPEPAFLFLLTTHVGGLGLNLTGADRVLIYDPDWVCPVSGSSPWVGACVTGPFH